MSHDPLEIKSAQLGSPSGIDFKVTKVILPYWPFYLISLISGFLIALFIIKTSPPLFEVKSKLLIKKESDQVSSDRDMIQVEMFNNEKVIENEMEILKSRGIVGEVINTLNLRVKWFKDNKSKDVLMENDFPIQVKLKSHENFPNKSKVPVSIDWNKKEIVLFGNSRSLLDTSTFMVDGFPIQVIWTDAMSFEYDKYNYFIQIVDFESCVTDCLSRLELNQRNKQSAILDMRFTYPNFQTARNFLNELVVQYIKQDLLAKKSMGKGTLHFIEERLNLLANQLDSVETDVEGFKTKNSIVDFKVQSASQLSAIENQKLSILDADIQLSILEEVKKYLKSNGDIVFTSPSMLGLKDEVLNMQLNTLHEKQEKLSRDKKTLGAKDMGLIVLSEEIETLKRQIFKIVDNMKSNLLASKLTIQNELDKKLAELSRLPSQEKSLMEITRQQEIKSAIFSFLLQKREEVAIALSAEDANIRVLEKPYGNLRSISPKKDTIMILSVLLSFLIPYILLYLYDWLKGRIVSREEIESLTGINVISQILHNYNKGTFLMTKSERSPIAESIRSIRTRLMHTIPKNESKVIFVCSAIPQEGKSFVSTNLGIAFGLVGKRTLILGADLRKPQLHKTFQIKNSKGLSSYLSDVAAVDDCIVKVDHENVWVLPAGPIPHNPSELLNSLSLDALFTELKERFDVIIVDTAPLILVSDAETMLKPTDTVVFVTRQKHTPKMVFKDALLKIQRLGITDINIVFNGVRTKGFGYYYMYGDYQYSYMYSYGGYFENEGIPSVNGKKWYSRLLSRMFKFKKRT